MSLPITNRRQTSVSSPEQELSKNDNQQQESSNVDVSAQVINILHQESSSKDEKVRQLVSAFRQNEESTTNLACKVMTTPLLLEIIDEASLRSGNTGVNISIQAQSEGSKGSSSRIGAHAKIGNQELTSVDIKENVDDILRHDSNRTTTDIAGELKDKIKKSLQDAGYSPHDISKFITNLVDDMTLKKEIENLKTKDLDLALQDSPESSTANQQYHKKKNLQISQEGLEQKNILDILRLAQEGDEVLSFIFDQVLGFASDIKSVLFSNDINVDEKIKVINQQRDIAKEESPENRELIDLATQFLLGKNPNAYKALLGGIKKATDLDNKKGGPPPSISALAAEPLAGELRSQGLQYGG